MEGREGILVSIFVATKILLLLLWMMFAIACPRCWVAYTTSLSE